MSYFEHVTFVVIFLVKAIIPASTSTMPIPHPRRRLGGGLLLEPRAMSGTGLRRAGTGLCYLLVSAA